MAGAFGTRRANSTQAQAYTLRVQSSIQGVPRPIVYGQARLAGNLIDYGGFLAVPVASSHGGKGGQGAVSGIGKGSNSEWDYYVGGIIAFGEPGGGIWTIYNGSSVNILVIPPPAVMDDLFFLGVTPWLGNTLYYVGQYNGSPGQTPDGGWQAQFGAARALAYRSTSYMLFERLALGTSPSFPNFEVEWNGLFGGGAIPALGPDANPADVIQDLLTNVGYGVPGWPANAIGDFATARNYWQATGLVISMVVAANVAAQSLFADLMKALNADFRWSSGVLDIVPYGDQPVSGNGYAFTPNLTPIYALTVDDFLPLKSGSGSGTSAVKVMRKSLNEFANKVQVEYLDRSILYNPVTIYATDDAAILATGRLKMSDLRQNHFFCLGSAASQSVALQLVRETAEQNVYQCRVGRQFILLDPMDIVTITEPALQLSQQLLRVVEIEEGADRTLTLTLVEVPGTAAAPIYGRQPAQGLANNANNPAPAVNPPIFFEPPDQLGGGLVLWIGLSGQTPANFGGCDVYLSSDGETYAKVGSFEGQSRMGLTTDAVTAIPAASSGVTIDNVNTLSVNLAESGATLASGSAADLIAFNTAFVVDSEIMAYEAAALTGPDAYNLAPPLARGGYQSTIAAHALGARWLRLDGNVFEWQFDASRVGTPLYWKFVAFNAFGGGGQDIANVGSYAYTPTGAALSSPLPNVTDIYTNFASGYQQIYWDEVVDFRNGIVYEIRQGSSWAAAIPIRTQAHPPFLANGDGTFWISAKCTPIAGMTVYSAAPQSITIAGNVLSSNLVSLYDEQANGWPGTLGSGETIQGTGATAYLQLSGVTVGPVYYTSAQIINVGYLAQASLSANFSIVGSPIGQNIVADANILTVSDILGSASTAFVNGWVEVNVGAYGGTDMFSAPDVFAASDVFSGVQVIWGGWQKLVPGVQLGQFFQFRLAMQTIDAGTYALALAFNYAVQVPARVDHYQNQSVPSGGLAITFKPDGASATAAFNGGPIGNALPYVSVSWPGSAGIAYYALSAFTLSGLTITFYNASGTAVAATGVNLDVEGF